MEGTCRCTFCALGHGYRLTYLQQKNDELRRERDDLQRENSELSDQLKLARTIIAEHLTLV